MELPPLAFHASLKDQWDDEGEPEEIETILKVFPPTYHQYLDLFTKVKAEKLPPHHACDHHMELKGLLPAPKNIKALPSFLGFANLYGNFIKNYSKTITSLTSLLNKDSPFIFNEEALSQFQLLKEEFTTSPILSHFNPPLPTIFETDASDNALGDVLSQVNDSGKHPIAFDGGKLLPAELNYGIHDKEFLGIFWALKRWRTFLFSLFHSFEVFTDHSSLQYFMSSKVLTCPQAHWAEFLSEFYFAIIYHPCILATLPDALSHWDDMYPERGVELIDKNNQAFHQILKQDAIQESRFFSIKVDMFSDLVDQIQKKVWKDKYYKVLK
ncbi:hypothetical protein O181_032497 [Austropuccinia psidii MF-1]|uniref:Reverse transcriptase RNase H-like domain-containing protein n=1 Tax=Austropuccinia psidii MF-1 TaxID=1389203 RepID=A0A9Q3D2Q2_9BASI|nr:hypothetical protein [Austropuccinia psidii MF-1]